MSSVPESVVADQISHFEIEHDLFRHEIDGWCAWHLLRFPVAMELMNLPLSSPARQMRLTGAERIAFAVKDGWSWLRPAKATYLIKTFDSALGELRDDGFHDVYFDQLLHTIEGGFKLQALNFRQFLPRVKEAAYPHNMTTTALDIAVGILSRLRVGHEFERVGNELSRALQTLNLHMFTSAFVSRMLRHFYWSKYWYKIILKRLRPRFVVVADTGEFGIIAAAKELSIQTFELQHGIVTHNHPHVLRGSARPYRAKLPIANQILLYGDYWKHELDKSGFYEDELVPVGNIRIDRYRDMRVKYQKKRRDHSCRILLTTQGLDTERLVCFIEEFLSLARHRDVSVALSIKLHPLYDSSSEIYRQRLDQHSNVDIFLGSEGPATFELLTQVDLHLSIASACHYDALGVGVPTVILPLEGFEMVEALYKDGNAFMARTPEQLFDIIERLHSPSDTAVSIDSSYFAKSQAIENINDILQAHL